MKLLQIPTANLEERIKEELEINPALEQGPEKEVDEYSLKDSKEDDYESSDDVELSDDAADKIDIDDYLKHEDDINTNDYNSYYGDSDNEQQSVPVRVETSFHEHLLSQLGMMGIAEEKRPIAIQIIGSIDEDGYLRRDVKALVDDLAFSRNIHTTEEEVAELVRKIQKMDPPGVCARSLQECLRLQLERIKPRTHYVDHALEVVNKNFNEFTKKHYDKIQRHIGVPDNEEFKEVINTIIRLNPKPGAAFAIINKAQSYILPDFFIHNNNGKLELSLNSKNAPELHVSNEYKQMMRAYDEGNKKDKKQKDAVQFIKQKLDSAKWFIDAIKQRQQTLMHTMGAIMDFQEEFFLTGDETSLKPMILKDIAEITNLDVSTVSRVANSKYVQTEFGTYLLKYFFSESLQTDSGEEVSTREVKSILQDIIDNENKRKPYSDEKLTKMLQEKGYNIARRTVAKYREQQNIPVARLRKEL